MHHHACVQAVYDTLETKDVYSRFFGGCMAGAMVKGSTLGANNGEFINVGEAAAKYTVRAAAASAMHIARSGVCRAEVYCCNSP